MTWKVSFVIEVNKHNTVKFKRVNRRTVRGSLLSQLWLSKTICKTFPLAFSRILANDVENEGYYVFLLIQLFFILLSSFSLLNLSISEVSAAKPSFIHSVSQKRVRLDTSSEVFAFHQCFVCWNRRWKLLQCNATSLLKYWLVKPQ